jgi:hypothetical protein
MGIRLSGGIGPLRMSLPVSGTATGFAGAGLAVIKGLFYLVWFELWLCYWALFGTYWLLRAVYWEAPRAGYRWWQRRQATLQGTR